VTGKVLLSPLASTSRTTVKATTLLTGFKNPVAVMLTPSGALLVGDWTSGKIYRISA
jgi:hypothetical protein